MVALWQGITVQRRVILALMLRETHTIYGDAKLGYLWVLIQSAFGIAVFWGVRVFVGAGDPHGLPVAIFLILGFGVWTVMADSIGKCLNAVRANQPLLTFPQVTELDVMLSRVAVIFVTQLVVSVLLLSVAYALGIEVRLNDAGLLYACLLLAPLFGLGCGMTLAALAVFIPSIERIVPLVMRLLFFVSGVFFSANSFGSDIAEILRLNPMLHLIELTRGAFSFSYPVDGMSLGYVSGCTLCLLSVGLLLERYVRPRRER